MGVRAVFLVGFMASGKSSVGQELARRLDWDFVDLDARIESRERQTISEIFRDRGEAGFRLAETSALRDLTGRVARTQQRGRARRRSLRAGTEPRIAAALAIGFLGSARIDELWRRSLDGRRWNGRCEDDPEQFARLYAERLPLYRQASVMVATSGKQLTSICAEIEACIAA